jgi:hypothetical protein
MRPPEVFVRELAPHEGQRLKRLSKRSKVAWTRQRALILCCAERRLVPTARDGHRSIRST